jgi:hypothetical protein
MIVSFDDPQIYTMLLRICAEYQADPSESLESENYFRTLLSTYIGTSDEFSLAQWLTQHISESFISMRDRPQWIQGFSWPFHNGKPMIFIGQLDIKANHYFHDDTSIFVFMPQNQGAITVVMQQF